MAQRSGPRLARAAVWQVPSLPISVGTSPGRSHHSSPTLNFGQGKLRPLLSALLVKACVQQQGVNELPGKKQFLSRVASCGERRGKKSVLSHVAEPYGYGRPQCFLSQNRRLQCLIISKVDLKALWPRLISTFETP